MANLRANKIVGIGSTDAGDTFDNPNKFKQWKDICISQRAIQQIEEEVVDLYTFEATGSICIQHPPLEWKNSINIQSHGNTIKFVDLTTNRYTIGAGANSTRGLFTGGYQDGLSPDTDVNTIEYITIAQRVMQQTFGDRIMVGRLPACASNNTRCVMASAFTPSGYQNIIDFVTFTTIGNAQNFGDLSSNRASMAMSCNSTTRGFK